MQQRRGAPFAARTVAFLFARACKRRDAPRAFATILGRGGDELAGPGRGSKAMSFLRGSPGARARRLPERNVRHRDRRPLQTA
jgi:hypothetical protein